MAKSQYETFAEIAKAVMKSGYGKDFVQKKRIYDMENKSRYVDVYDEEATITRLCLTMERGAEIGIMPLQSLYSIVWYTDRPCIYGDVALAMCKSHPEWAGMDKEEKFDCDRPEWECTTIIYRKNNYGPTKKHEGKFSWKDAVDAGLARLPHYQEYGKRMLAIRSRVWALRDAFPDVLGGLSIAEEMKDFDMVNQLKASEKQVSETVSASAALDKFTQAAIDKKGDVKPDLDEAMAHRFIPGQAIEVSPEQLQDIVEGKVKIPAGHRECTEDEKKNFLGRFSEKQNDKDNSGITFNESVIENDLESKISVAKPGEAIKSSIEQANNIIADSRSFKKNNTANKIIKKLGARKKSIEKK